jgi:hypothetical protein
MQTGQTTLILQSQLIPHVIHITGQEKNQISTHLLTFHASIVVTIGVGVDALKIHVSIVAGMNFVCA